ncbi:hypothetical protein GP486_000127 [Trichoglossum hirsutum]|uniref:DUF1014-domain-containing protein n=1 Tax=Trichoglossum hirsutum TaxID=265104 RepID=A0A9P8LJG1_9PEZI|nr:hypothetical protein GP486_000127 [Trichoglossum hirsutum]
MAGKKALGENSKKAAGNARKAEAAARKTAEADAKKAQLEDQEWAKGSKSNAKKEAADAKKAEAARRKAEREAQMAEEEKSLKSASAAKAAKVGKDKAASKRPAKPLSLDDLGDDDELPSSSAPTLSASGIDNALDALSLTASSAHDKVDRHPERRFKAALAAYEARRMPEVEAEYPGLRMQQRKELIRKEFDKAPENPFNQVTARFDATKEEVEEVKRREREKVESRLAGK